MGGKWTPEYQAWISMKARCYNPRTKDYGIYGGRPESMGGPVTVCQEWLQSFSAFLDHVGLRPSPEHSLDRINAYGNYEIGNARWALPSEQRENQRQNYHVVTASIICVTSM
jgi:hypothetical protein